MASARPTTDTRAARVRRGLPAWQAVLGAAALAALVDLLVLLIGDAAGASLVVELGGEPDGIGAADVVLVSALAPALGVTAAVLLARWRPGFLRAAQLVAAAVTAVSLGGPLTLETDGGTAVTIAVMHLVVGAAAVAALEAVRRSR